MTIWKRASASPRCLLTCIVAMAAVAWATDVAREEEAAAAAAAAAAANYKMGKSDKKKGHRKGGPKYIANADELASRDEREAENNAERQAKRKERIAEANGTAAAESESEEEDFDALVEAEVEAEKPKKPKGAAGVLKTANPNDQRQERGIKIKDMAKMAAADGEAAAPRLTRKEREAQEAERKKAAYDKLHAEGKTDEYQRDMERLKAAKARREAQEAERKAAAEREAELEEERRIAAEMEQLDIEENGVGGFPKLEARDVKKYNGKQLKDALKERGLDTQGQKKDLIARLLAFQA